MTRKDHGGPVAGLRVASLLPSTTDICISLGLQNNVVGITHECDFPVASHPLFNRTRNTSASIIVTSPSDIRNNDIDINIKHPLTLTVSHIDPYEQSQADIDAAVRSSLSNGISLYNLHGTALTDAQPTVILTQTLCDVCAVAKDEVDNQVACHSWPGQCKVLSLEPECLNDVVETFVTVAKVCGVQQRGDDLKERFWKDIAILQKIIAPIKMQKRPRIVFLEWLDPPFDAGHWIPDMFELSGCVSALSMTKPTRKSITISWEQLYECDPDVIVIGCCGFGLKRNQIDTVGAMEKLKPLRAYKEERIYASDGNLYFARPGPGLREGIAILARCAYDGNVDVVTALESLVFLPQEGKGWVKMIFPREDTVPDVEDIMKDTEYFKLHDLACQAKHNYYKDPKTGYTVFTEYGHKKRGTCCGAGCRHCPFNHVNVKDKSRIQQPAFLYEGSKHAQSAIFTGLSSITSDSKVKVLFFSGGKDSFLAVRALVHQQIQDVKTNRYHLILLTTFDSETRIIAHQKIHIDTIVRQAQHLELPLLGIPLRRASGETYLSRIEIGIDTIKKRIPNCHQTTLVFGDLHLDHIRQWREKELSKYALEFPLWKVPYDNLMEDLETSGIRVVLTATTKEGVSEGMLFTRSLWKEIMEKGMDGFGEEGEFHSVAEVWTVSREQALGIPISNQHA